MAYWRRAWGIGWIIIWYAFVLLCMIVLILIIKLHFALAPTNGKRYTEWMMPGDSTRLVIFLHCHLDAIWLATTRRALRPLISPAHSIFTSCCDLWITNLVYFGKKKSFIIHISVVSTRFGVPEHLHLTLIPDLLTYGNVSFHWIANWWFTLSSPSLTLGHEAIEICSIQAKRWARHATTSGYLPLPNY